MKYRKGVSLVIYKRRKNKIFYLILKRKLRWKGYELCKGGKEKRESDIKAVKRELKEETKLIPIKIIKLDKKLRFNYSKKYQEFFDKKGFEANCYLVEVKGRIKLSKEHSSYKWLEYNWAKEILGYPNLKEIIKSANRKIKKE